MPDITQRIADIIRAEYDKRPAAKYPTEHSLAEVLTAELGLTREGPSCREYTGLHRYVTQWMPDE